MEDLGDPTDRNDTDQLAAASEHRLQEHVDEHQTQTTSNLRRVLHRPDFYSVIIAAIALLVSLLTPILNLLKGTSVEVSIASMASLTTFAIGYPGLNIHIGVENTGGRPSTIRQFNCNLTHMETSKNWPMEVYVSLGRGSNSFGQPDFHPLGWISIKAGEVWSGVVRCESLLPDADRVINNRIMEEFDQSIQKQQARRIFQTSGPVRVPDNLTKKATRLFDERFDLLAGAYEMTVTAILAQSEADVTATRHFEIAPSAIDQLRRIPAPPYKGRFSIRRRHTLSIAQGRNDCPTVTISVSVQHWVTTDTSR